MEINFKNNPYKTNGSLNWSVVQRLFESMLSNENLLESESFPQDWKNISLSLAKWTVKKNLTYSKIERDVISYSAFQHLFLTTNEDDSPGIFDVQINKLSQIKLPSGYENESPIFHESELISVYSEIYYVLLTKINEKYPIFTNKELLNKILKTYDSLSETLKKYLGYFIEEFKEVNLSLSQIFEKPLFYEILWEFVSFDNNATWDEIFEHLPYVFLKDKYSFPDRDGRCSQKRDIWGTSPLFEELVVQKFEYLPKTLKDIFYNEIAHKSNSSFCSYIKDTGDIHPSYLQFVDLTIKYLIEKLKKFTFETYNHDSVMSVKKLIFENKFLRVWPKISYHLDNVKKSREKDNKTLKWYKKDLEEERWRQESHKAWEAWAEAERRRR